ncbi:MAG TPA: hypothetical protein VE988_30235 [Gemmataceae bacterium]|nr:hypothetical protein [Gemmataceae bacterium]
MALEAALLDLGDRWKRLAAHVETVENRACDTPDGHEHYLAGEISDAARDAIGWLRKARRTTQRARRELVKNNDIRRVRDALSKCQQFMKCLRRGPARVLLSARKKADLKDLARRHPKHWSDWVADVKAALQDLRKPWRAASRALSRSWQDLAEYATAGQVTIHNVAVGQQIVGKRGKLVAGRE